MFGEIGNKTQDKWPMDAIGWYPPPKVRGGMGELLSRESALIVTPPHLPLT